MKTLLTLTLVLVILIGASGCRDDSAVISGAVVTYSPNRVERPLSAGQVLVLNEWLVANGSSFHRRVATAPVAADSIIVKRASGETGGFSFFDQEGWKGAVVYEGDTAASNAEGSFPPEKVAELRRVLFGVR